MKLFFRLGILLITMVCGTVMAQSRALHGAEIEVNSKHLTAIAAQVDFRDLEARFRNVVLAEQHLPSDITKDLPLVMSGFLDVIPSETKRKLLEGLTDSATLAVPTVLHSEDAGQIKTAHPIPSQQGLILLPDMQAPAAERPALKAPGLFVPGPTAEQKQAEHQTSNQMSSYVWQTVNARWNQLSEKEKLSLLPWERLPLALQSKLLVYLYHLQTSETDKPSDTGFKVDALDLQFRDPRLAELYAKFYPLKDGPGIVEYHTLNPKTREPFFAELKEFLRFLGIEKRILFPARNERKDLSLHIHFSSPDLMRFDLNRFVLDYKRMMVFRALEKGDISILISPDTLTAGGMQMSVLDLSYKPVSNNKDLIRLWQDPNSPEKRIEVRHFLENVEGEMLELEQVSKMGPEQAQAYLYEATAKVMNRNLIRFVLKNTPEYFYELLPLEVWQNVQLTADDKKVLSDFLSDRLTMLTRNLRKMSSIQNLSEGQKEIIESSLSLFMKNHPGEVLGFETAFELRQLGFEFKNELIAFKKNSLFASNIQKHMLQAIQMNTEGYAERMDRRADEEFVVRSVHSFGAPRPETELLLAKMIEFSAKDFGLQGLVLTSLQDPKILQNLQRSNAIKPLFLNLVSEAENFESEYFRKVVTAMLGANPDSLAWRYIRENKKSYLEKKFLEKMQIFECRQVLRR